MRWEEPPASAIGDAVLAARRRPTTVAGMLRANPGRWGLVAEGKSYRGGASWYREKGFLHRVRKNKEGGWDHYLMWPGAAAVA